jgi:hypothetical protein
MRPVAENGNTWIPLGSLPREFAASGLVRCEQWVAAVTAVGSHGGTCGHTRSRQWVQAVSLARSPWYYACSEDTPGLFGYLISSRFSARIVLIHDNPLGYA